MHDSTAPRTRGRAATPQRRGATLVLVAVTMSVLCMFAGLGVDMARMYTFVAQVKGAADAVALSAAHDRKAGAAESPSKTTALLLRGTNRVNGADSVAIAASDIVPGTWNFGARTFAPAVGGWNDAAVNAIQVTASYTANWTLGRVFGGATRTITQVSVAAIGSRTASACLKPFAVPYSLLLQRLGLPINMAYNLTNADVAALNSVGATINMADMRDVDPALAPPGAFGLLNFNGNNTPDVAASISGCTYVGGGVGTNISGATGNKWNANAMKNAIQALCGGNPNCPAGNPPILVPIYDQATYPGSNAQFRIKYIGAFKLVSYSTTGADAVLSGYLTSITSATGTGFSSSPGPVRTEVLVQ